MKNSTPTLTLLGNNSGRNLGDAAILSSILHTISTELPDAKFLVPSIVPEFIDSNYSVKAEDQQKTNKRKTNNKAAPAPKRYFVKGVNVKPYTGSLRLLGIPTLINIAKSDVALICDGIIFGHKLFSVHNFLITLIFLAPWAKLTNCKLVAFCCGIGPFPSKLSERLARFLLNSCDLISMRELESKNLAQKIGVTKPIEVSGDIAFLNPVHTEQRGKEILKHEGLDPQKPILGFNVTPYIDDWLTAEQKVKNRDSFINNLAKALGEALQTLGEQTQLAIFSCSPMDEEYSRMLATLTSEITTNKATIITNTEYLSHDIQAAMRECRILVGMRFHSLVLASAVGTPIVGLIYAPKVRDYFSYLQSSEYSMELADITPNTLTPLIIKAWEQAPKLKQQQQQLVEVLRKRAAANVSSLIARVYPERHESLSAKAIGSCSAR